MAVSGTKSFEPDVAEYIEEAFETMRNRIAHWLRFANRDTLSQPDAG
jgi:hypothetical protein